MTDHLQRQHAPITDAGWDAIDEEATRSLRQYLSARPLVDFTGPLGWQHAAQPTGRARGSPSPSTRSPPAARSHFRADAASWSVVRRSATLDPERQAGVRKRDYWMTVVPTRGRVTSPDADNPSSRRSP